MKPILKQVRECVRRNRYVVTVHAAEEMDDDGLTIFDVERLILAGEIKEPPETKVLFRGPTLDGDNSFAVVKLAPTGKLVIVTVFKDIYG